MYTSGVNTELIANCDADYAGDPDTNRNTIGYIIYFSGGSASWSSRKQHIVTTTSTEAEYAGRLNIVKDLFISKF